MQIWVVSSFHSCVLMLQLCGRLFAPVGGEISHLLTLMHKPVDRCCSNFDSLMFSGKEVIECNMNLVWASGFNLFHAWTFTNYVNYLTGGLLLRFRSFACLKANVKIDWLVSHSSFRRPTACSLVLKEGNNFVQLFREIKYAVDF